MDTEIILDKLEVMDRKLEVMDSKFDVMERKIDVMEGKIDVLATDIIDLKGKVVDMGETISREVRDLGESLHFSLNKIDARLESKVSYDEHNKLAGRVSDIEGRFA